MDSLRGRLISKIDDLLVQLANAETPPNALLQVEASLVVPQEPIDTSRRVLVDSIDIDQLKHDVASPAATFMNPSPQFSNVYGDRHLPPPPDMVSAIPGSFGQMSQPVAHVAGPTTVMPLAGLPMISNISPSSHNILAATTQTATDPTPPRTPIVDEISAIEHSRSLSPVQQELAAADRISQRLSPIDKLIEGVWEQIHSPKMLAFGDELRGTMHWLFDKLSSRSNDLACTEEEFSETTRLCLQITTGSRTARAFEVIIQAHWMDRFDARLATVKHAQPDLKLLEHKKLVLTEACTSFSCSEKELRNRMSIWNGYREIKDAAGWSALVFAGPGIYRYCKYRKGNFDDESMQRLRCLRIRAEVAADTLQPQWRDLLSLVGETTQVRWTGHPHDWTVSLSEGEDALPLAVTYKQWDPEFSFRNLSESIVDTEKFQAIDPRRFESGPDFFCKSCSQRQSPDPTQNLCECFPALYSPSRPQDTPTPVQIFRTPNGKNNGLQALITFGANSAVGEFLGLVTKGLTNIDVMQSQAHEDLPPYQIHQGRMGNFTRFINHSCASNCAFQTFAWLGIQRIVVVTKDKGVRAGEELTVDYSNQYWDNLDKVCLCGEACCRYREPRRRSMG